MGRPIPVEKNEKPTAEELDVLHQLYMDELSLLFEEHKGNYGVAEDAHLLFHWEDHWSDSEIVYACVYEKETEWHLYKSSLVSVVYCQLLNHCCFVYQLLNVMPIFLFPDECNV